MEALTAHLCDFVLPDVPLRFWTLSMPFDLRRLLSFDAKLLSAVHRLFVRVVFGYVARQATRAGIVDGRAGAVSFLQRFGGALNANLHFHLAALDGVYVKASDGERPRFCEVPAVRQSEVEDLALEMAERTRKLLRRRGLLAPSGEPLFPDEEIDAPVAHLAYAQGLDSVQAGTLGANREAHAFASRFQGAGGAGGGPRLADVEGFNLHCDLRVEAGDSAGRVRLCRYGLRPAFALDQLSETDDGRIAFALRKPRRNGTTHLFFTPIGFLRRLAWLVAPPR
jgi:hypothetical protein